MVLAIELMVDCELGYIRFGMQSMKSSQIATMRYIVKTIRSNLKNPVIGWMMWSTEVYELSSFLVRWTDGVMREAIVYLLIPLY